MVLIMHEKRLMNFSSIAIEAISQYPDSVYKDSLIDLVAYNIQRTG